MIKQICGATITDQVLFNAVTKGQLKGVTLTNLSELCDMLAFEIYDRSIHGEYPATCCADLLLDTASCNAAELAMLLRNAQRAIDDAKDG